MKKLDQPELFYTDVIRTNIVKCRPQDATIGQLVRVNWDREAGDYIIPTFELVAKVSG